MDSLNQASRMILYHLLVSINSQLHSNRAKNSQNTLFFQNATLWF